MNIEDVNLAKKARLNACSPYSNYQVGAALRTKSGKVYLGCNIENHGIQALCAERTAFAKALSEGEREFESITVVGGKKGEEPTEKCMPCGYIYDPEIGDPDSGIAPGTKFEDIPDTWVCPLCGVGKDMFEKID